MCTCAGAHLFAEGEVAGARGPCADLLGPVVRLCPRTRVEGVRRQQVDDHHGWSDAHRLKEATHITEVDEACLTICEKQHIALERHASRACRDGFDHWPQRPRLRFAEASLRAFGTGCPPVRTRSSGSLLPRGKMAIKGQENGQQWWATDVEELCPPGGVNEGIFCQIALHSPSPDGGVARAPAVPRRVRACLGSSSPYWRFRSLHLSKASCQAKPRAPLARENEGGCEKLYERFRAETENLLLSLYKFTFF